MGVYYTPKNKKKVARSGHSGRAGTYLSNYSGADTLGLIHQAAGASMAANPPGFSLQSRPKYEASDELCKADARKIRALTPARLASLHALVEGKLFIGTIEEFAQYVSDWAAFLETCGGYEAD